MYVCIYAYKTLSLCMCVYVCMYLPFIFNLFSKVPMFVDVKLKRPIGLHVMEGPNKAVLVQYIKPNLGASRSRRVEVG